MKKDSLPTFKKFNKEFELKKVDEASGKASKKLQKATEDYHDAQLKLQQLQNEFVKTAKEDPNKREELKQAIIAQNKIVKQKESIFAKALGDEDIEDFEI
jgi:ABC-type transporter Mla subunit MlaD